MARPGQWSLIACDGSGNFLTELTTAQGVSLTFQRNGVPECQLSLSHDDDACASILEGLMAGTGGGVPTLKGYRLGRDGSKPLRFNGYLAGVSEESGTEASTATFTFRGPFSRLLGDGPNRGIPMSESSTLVFTATDAGQIAKTIIDDLNALSHGPLGLSVGTIEASKTRDRSYPFAQNAGEAIVNLTNVLDGFDFEVAPVEGGTTLGTFNVYASQGSDRPNARFEYGPTTLDNCSAMHRQIQPPVTLAGVLGANGLVASKTSASGVAKYGRFWYVESQPSVSEQVTLDDRALALHRPEPLRAIDFTPEPALAPSPFDDYWIGDTVRFYANRGALVVDPVSVRVNQIRVVIDPDTGFEAAAIPDPDSGDGEGQPIRASLQTEVVD